MEDFFAAYASGRRYSVWQKIIQGRYSLATKYQQN